MVLDGTILQGGATDAADDFDFVGHCSSVAKQKRRSMKVVEKKEGRWKASPTGADGCVEKCRQDSKGRQQRGVEVVK